MKERESLPGTDCSCMSLSVCVCVGGGGGGGSNSLTCEQDTNLVQNQRLYSDVIKKTVIRTTLRT